MRGGLGCGFGRRFDQVDYAFGLRQVEFVIEEGAMREFTGLRHAQADVGAGFQAARQQHLQHDRTAVALQLQHVFAGIGMRRLEVKRQTLVDHAAIGVDEVGESRMPRL
ncbi:hypothetical protein D3C81_1388130 [compost metagenome]